MTGSAYKRYRNLSEKVATIDKVGGELFCSVGIILNYQEKSATVIPRSLRIASIIPFTVIADCCFFS